MSSKGKSIESHGSMSIQKGATLYVDANGAYNAVSVATAQHFVTAGTNLVLGSGVGSSITLNPGTGGIVFKKAAPVTQLTSTSTAVTSNGSAGVITCFTSTAATGVTATFIVNNTFVKSTSVIDVKVNGYTGGVFGTNGIPVASVVSIVDSTSFTVVVSNVGGNALAGVVTLGYLIV